jgi:hypothetical protein
MVTKGTVDGKCRLLQYFKINKLCAVFNSNQVLNLFDNMTNIFILFLKEFA